MNEKQAIDLVRAKIRLKHLAGQPLSVPITPHVLRHGFGTHFAGDIRDLQAILGHKSLETTAIYRHPEIHRAASPLETLPAEAIA